MRAVAASVRGNTGATRPGSESLARRGASAKEDVGEEESKFGPGGLAGASGRGGEACDTEEAGVHAPVET